MIFNCLMDILLLIALNIVFFYFMLLSITTNVIISLILNAKTLKRYYDYQKNKDNKEKSDQKKKKMQLLKNLFSNSKKEEKSIVTRKEYQEALKIERNILNMSPIGQLINVRDVYFEFRGDKTFLHTLECGQNNNQYLVLVHGYGGSGVTFYSILKQLSEIYHVFAIDLLGMGLSDRKDFKVDTSTECAINFFIDSLDLWREQLNLDKFVLVGHSFGGYISANYAINYSEHVQELFLLSPMAGTKVSPTEDISSEENFKEYAEQQPILQQLLLKFVRKMHQNNQTLQGLARKWFIPTKYLLSSVLNQKMHSISKLEKQQWKKYFTHVLSLPESSDHLIHSLICFPFVQSKLSIEEIFLSNIEKLTFKIHFAFGDSDWMDARGCNRIAKKIQASFIYVLDASHQVIFDQPQQIVQIILDPKKACSP